MVDVIDTMTQVTDDFSKIMKLNQRAINEAAAGKFGYEGMSITRRHEIDEFIGDIYGCERIIDIGCGPGYLLRAIADKLKFELLVGLDISGVMLNLAYEKIRGVRNVQLVCSSATDIPYSNDAFDCAVLFNVLQDVPKPAVCLGEVQRIIANDGLVFATVPPRDSVEKLFEYSPKKFDHKSGLVYNFDGGVTTAQQTFYKADFLDIFKPFNIVHLTEHYLSDSQIRQRWADVVSAEQFDRIERLYGDEFPVLYNIKARVRK